MIKMSQKQQKIISVLLQENGLSSSAIHAKMATGGEGASLVTIKRTLAELAGKGIVLVSGSGRSTTYMLGTLGRIFAAVDAHAYCAVEPDKRYGQSRYNFDLLSGFPAEIFSDDEAQSLRDATAVYQKRITGLSEAVNKKELERLVIELSWKSSKIEGNTYTLLDTEKLIVENKTASGKTKDETQMILNHKSAFAYIRKNRSNFLTVTRKNVEELHSILVHDLPVGQGLRSKPVGVVGSLYRPLDNTHQIHDAVERLEKSITRMADPYAKALLALVGLAYIQPFEDGNKRTARLMTNAILLAHHLAPLSYRSVDENEYREAMLVVYELNSIVPIKKIFIEQYVFAATTYSAV